ncbi:hypothetical protein DL93DRAFT_2164109 [Clavulina sp. PMI_390]|nr:hypothetical protein DL93DRAFT_2164109 [Clavulina sp. PMI_390]
MDAESDFTMQLAPESTTFIVHGVRFRIPVALLEHHCHSSSLQSVGLASSHEHDIVRLGDPLEAFQDFRSMVFVTPDSCLFPGNPIAQDFGRLFNLLVLLHNYHMDTFKDHVITLVAPLATPAALDAYLSSSDPEACQGETIYRISAVNEQPAILSGIRDALTDRLWRQDSSVSPYQMLALAFEHDDKKLWGAAYYQIMLQNPTNWDIQDLTHDHRHNIELGMRRFAAAWDVATTALAISAASIRPHTTSDPASSSSAAEQAYPIPTFLSQCCWKQRPEPQTAEQKLIKRKAKISVVSYQSPSIKLYTKLALARILWCDYIAKVQILLETQTSNDPECPSHPPDVTGFAELQRIKDNIFVFFDPTVDEQFVLLSVERVEDSGRHHVEEIPPGSSTDMIQSQMESSEWAAVQHENEMHAILP